MHNYSVVNKGDYTHKQTSENVNVSKFIIIRKKHKRILVLELENKRLENLTALSLQIDQFNGKGNFLGVKNARIEKLDKSTGKFILHYEIELHRACVDVFVKVLSAEYGEYRFCLDEHGEYSVFNEKAPEQKLNQKEISKKVGKSGQAKFWHKFRAPAFIRALSIVVLAVVIGISAWQVIDFKKEQDEFTLAGITYEFVDDSRADDAPVVITGTYGFGDTIIVSDSIEGHPIYKIEQNAFSGNKNVKKVVINGNVLFDSYSFADCTNLESAMLYNVSIIPEGTFSNCAKLKQVEIHNAEKINAYAFKACSNLQEFIVTNENEESVLAFENNVFNAKNTLTTLKIEQFIDFSQRINAFNGLNGALNLSLKNFNYAPYESAPENTEHNICELFGTTTASVENLRIEYSDKIPQYFAKGLVDRLKTVNIENLESTVLGDYAFQNCTKLVEVNVPNPFTEVGQFAFSKTAIDSFDASEVLRIGTGAFMRSSKLKQFDLTENNLLTEIPEDAFSGTTSLESIHFSSELTVIGKNAFNGSGISKAEFEPSINIEIIERALFAKCVNLKEIIIPESVNEIGISAFENCKALETVVLPSNLKVIGNKAFYNDASLRQIEMPDTITNIGIYVLYGCKSIENIKVPYFGNVKSADGYLGYLFGADSYLNNVNFVPDSLVSVSLTDDNSVGTGAFYACHNLKEIILPIGATAINDLAFFECYNLNNITIPSAVTSITSGAFEKCYRLFEIKNLSSVSVVRGDINATYALAVYGKYDSPMQSEIIDGYKFLKAKDGWYLVDIPNSNSLVLPTSVNNRYYSIPKYFFYLVEADSVKLTKGVSFIGDYAFSDACVKDIYAEECYVQFGEKVFFNNAHVEKVDFGNSLITEIPAETFSENLKLTTVVLPNSVQYIRENAFYKDSALSSINMPNSLEIIENSAFRNCSNLTTVDFSGAKLKAIGERVFEGCKYLTTLNLGTSVESIGNRAFTSCPNLKEVVIPASVTYIGQDVLFACGYVDKLVIPFIGSSISDNRNIGYFFGVNISAQANYRIANTIEVTNDDVIAPNCFANCKQIKEVILRAPISVIGNDAFSNCYKLNSVKLPSTLIELQNSAFYSCTDLQSVEFLSAPYVIPQKAFFNCSSLQSINLPYGITAIESGAFDCCYSLKSVEIPDSVAIIGDCAFQNCAELMSLNLPDSVISITDNAFSNCYNITSVKTPNNLLHIGANAFSGCAISELVLNSALEDIGEYAFYGSNITELVLPENLLYIGNNAFADSKSLECVIIPSGVRHGVLVENEAFYGCSRLYQVYDLANLGVSRLGDEFGGVAKYAVVVDTSSEEPRLINAVVQNLVVKYRQDVLAIVDYNGNSRKLTLSNINVKELSFNNYIIASYAFGYDVNLSELKINGVEVEIYPYAFMAYNSLVIFEDCNAIVNENGFYDAVERLIYDRHLLNVNSNAFSNVYGVYYFGTNYEWQIYNSSFVPSNLTPNYYYNECIHEYGTNFWNYDKNKNINLSLSPLLDRVVLEPTCEGEGVGENYCDKCSHVETYYISPTGHDSPLHYRVALEPTCEEMGICEYYCSRCTYVETYSIPATGHDLPLHYRVVLEPTCEEMGICEYYCSRCTYVETYSIPATDHDSPLHYRVVLEPTCEEMGVCEYYCSKCTYVETYSIPATGHDSPLHDRIVLEPTCEEEGIGERYCSKCTYVEQYSISATGHDSPLHDRIVLEPTCENEGIGEKYCSKCSHVEQYSISAKGHKYADYICMVCGSIKPTSINLANYSNIINDIFTQVNLSEKPFETFNSNVYAYGIQSTNKEVLSSSTITFIANTNVVFSFEYTFSCEDIGQIVISVNDNVITTEQENSTSAHDFGLSKGDKISISFIRNEVEVEDCFIRLYNLKIS